MAHQKFGKCLKLLAATLNSDKEQSVKGHQNDFIELVRYQNSNVQHPLFSLIRLDGNYDAHLLTTGR